MTETVKYLSAKIEARHQKMTGFFLRIKDINLIVEVIYVTVIYFVRHAEPNYQNHVDRTRELSEKGLRDRQLVTEFLSDKHIDVVLSSPYKRAIDTVKHFSDAKRLVVGLIEDFRERKIEDEWIDDFTGFCKKQWADFNYKLADGESLSEVQARNIAALNQVLIDYDGQNVVIGSHGTALSTIINYFDPLFGYNDFEAIRTIMPWIVKFTFDDDGCSGIQKFNLLNPSRDLARKLAKTSPNKYEHS